MVTHYRHQSAISWWLGVGAVGTLAATSSRSHHPPSHLSVRSFVVPFIFQSLPLLPEVYHSHGLGLCLRAVACRFELVRNHLPHRRCFTFRNALKAHILLVSVPGFLFRVTADASDAFKLAMLDLYDKS
jgi:hypothetical protein